jgi:anti-sigma regulatory factor (Ser/Thr protein kinase)
MSQDSGAIPQGAEPTADTDGAMRLRLEVNSCLTDLHYAVVAIRSWCEMTEIYRASAWKIELAVMEALTNIVVHSYQARCDQPISVVWEKRQDRLVIEIRDEGKAMSNPPDEPFPAAEAEGGRGWPIIRACVDRVTYRSEDGTNVLTLEQEARAH